LPRTVTFLPGREEDQIMTEVMQTAQMVEPDTRTKYSHRKSQRVDEIPENLTYVQMMDDARRCMGHGAEPGAFPEEWDAQMLVDCGRAVAGERVIIFAPAFLKVLVGDETELDRAFKFIMLMMDGIAMKEQYTFVYCHSGTNWLNPQLTSKVRIAYDIMPARYAENCKRFYILHPTLGLRMTIMGFWGWLSGKVWGKMEYVHSLEELCQKIHPSDPLERSEFRRRFPQLIQREDAIIQGVPPPTAFGTPLENLCNTFGIDFTDKTTGRWYPRLPPGMVFLCEALERQNAVVEFRALFGADSTNTSDLVADIDEGEPLDPDTPAEALWCVLKIYLDCLPEPLFTYESLTRLKEQDIQIGDRTAHHKFIKEVLQDMPEYLAHAALYLASFLHTMCEAVQTPSKGQPSTEAAASDSSSATASGPLSSDLTYAAAAEVFAPAFMRPVSLTQEVMPLLPVCVSLVETLLISAEDQDLWTREVKQPAGRRTIQTPRRTVVQLPDAAAVALLEAAEHEAEDDEASGLSD